MSNAGTIMTLTNTGEIDGGAGRGGAGVSNAGMIMTLSNSGKIAGAARAGGYGVSNAGTITILTNRGAIVRRRGAQQLRRGRRVECPTPARSRR